MNFNPESYDDNIIVSMYCQCKNIDEIRKDTGLRLSCIRSVLKRNKIEIDNERKSPRYKAWRSVVLKRDKWTCQMCGSKKRLQVHHIIPFIKNKELRTVISNGITLCRDCHDKINGKEHEFEEIFYQMAGIDEMIEIFQETERKIIESKSNHCKKEKKEDSIRRWNSDFERYFKDCSMNKLFWKAREHYPYLPVRIIKECFYRYHKKKSYPRKKPKPYF